MITSRVNLKVGVSNTADDVSQKDAEEDTVNINSTPVQDIGMTNIVEWGNEKIV